MPHPSISERLRTGQPPDPPSPRRQRPYPPAPHLLPPPSPLSLTSSMPRSHPSLTIISPLMDPEIHTDSSSLNLPLTIRFDGSLSMNLMSGIGILHESTSPNTIFSLYPDSSTSVRIWIIPACLTILNPLMTLSMMNYSSKPKINLRFFRTLIFSRTAASTTTRFSSMSMNALLNTRTLFTQPMIQIALPRLSMRIPHLLGWHHPTSSEMTPHTSSMNRFPIYPILILRSLSVNLRLMAIHSRC